VSAEQEAHAEEGIERMSEESASPRPQSALHALKQDMGPVGLERVLQESAKLERIEQLGLPVDLFAQVSAKTLDSYRSRIAVEELQEVRRHPDPIRFTLLSAYCWRRRQEIVDTLVELLMEVVHHLSTKAERRVEKAFVKDIKKVSGKTNLLFRLAEAGCLLYIYSEVQNARATPSNAVRRRQRSATRFPHTHTSYSRESLARDVPVWIACSGRF
jgi:hypothetical protein